MSNEEAVTGQYRFFDLQKSFTLVGHSLSLTLAPGRTRKSFELIFIFILSAMSAALFESAYSLVSASGVFCSASSAF
jgi:myo-inositol-hexaphosphate 3-phosphohydrolase